MNQPAMPYQAPTPGRRRSWLWAAVALVIAVAFGIGAWQGAAWWKAREARAQARDLDAQVRLDGLDQQLLAVRGDQRTQSQRLQDAAATNRILRDEVLGLGQRGAVLEETVAKLADSQRQSAQALRLDEVELLLGQAAQRLDLAGDVDGARRAAALAAGVLDGIQDPTLLNAKQALVQERKALDALGPGPRAAATLRLEQVASQLEALPHESPVPAAGRGTWWQRMLAPLVDVRPSQEEASAPPAERAAGVAALQIELSLARAAIERADTAGLRGASSRVDAWTLRLWPDSPGRRGVRQQLQALRVATLKPASPDLGTTLAQLQALHGQAAQNRTP